MSAGPLPAAPVAAPVASGLAFEPVVPVRIVDTRDGFGAGRLGAGATTRIQVAGAATIPGDAEAVSANFTVTGSRGPGSLTAWNCSRERPVVATANFGANDTTPNAASIPLDPSGAICVYSPVDVDLVVDVNGYYGSRGTTRFAAVTPSRLLDTRSGASGRLRHGETVALRVTGNAGIPNGSPAVVLNVTAVDPGADGYVTVYPCDQPRPLAAALNPHPGENRSNLVISPLSADGHVCFYSSAPVDLVADATGYLTTTTTSFTTSAPFRFTDTRDRQHPATDGYRLASGTTLVLQIAGQRNIPTNTRAVSINLAAADATGPGFLTAHPCDDRPTAATLTYDHTQPTSTGAVTPLSPTGQLCIYTNTSTHIVIDVNGWWKLPSGTPAPGLVPSGPVPPVAVPPVTPPPVAPPPVSPPPAAPVLPAPSPGGGACTVSALLVPSCGAWLGASTASVDGTYDYERGMAEYEGVAQNTPDIIHFYKKNAAQFPSSKEIAQSQRPGKQRSILFYNWKPNASMSWGQIADGGADANIATVAASLKRYPHKLFLAIWHEPENDSRVGQAGMMPRDYAAMFRHTVQKLRSHGVTNAVFVMNYMGSANWADVVDDYYPGDDVVDWIGYDPYGFAKHTTFGQTLNDTPNRSWPGFYSWATAKAPGKPIMLAEWGLDLAKQPTAPAILDGALPIIQTQFPMIKAFVYWHDDFDHFKVRLDQPGALGTAYGQAYKRFAAQPYFNSTPTELAP